MKFEVCQAILSALSLCAPSKIQKSAIGIIKLLMCLCGNVFSPFATVGHRTLSEVHSIKKKKNPAAKFHKLSSEL